MAKKLASLDELRAYLDDLRFEIGDTTVAFLIGPVLWFGYVRAATDQWAFTNGTDLWKIAIEDFSARIGDEAIAVLNGAGRNQFASMNLEDEMAGLNVLVGQTWTSEETVDYWRGLVSTLLTQVHETKAGQ